MRALYLVFIVAVVSSGCGGEDSPAAPSSMVSSVQVAQANPAETIFVGQTIQFTATSTLSTGDMQVASGTWGSDNTRVATVDQNGLVTAIAPGEATIFVDVNPRGMIRIRVFSRFGGTWAGLWVVTDCVDSGMFTTLNACGGTIPVGFMAPFLALMTQNRDLVSSAALDFSLFTGETNGTSSIGGLLQLNDTSLQLSASSPFPPLEGRLQEWQSTIPTPGRMEGTFRVHATSPEISGDLLVSAELRDVNGIAGNTAGLRSTPASSP